MSLLKLTSKESFLLKKLVDRLTKLGQFMQAEGLSNQDVNDFVLRCVFQVPFPNGSQKPILTKGFSSETQEETNSQSSEWSQVEISLQKVFMEKVTNGKNLNKILLNYLEKCCAEEEKLKNYLKSEQVQDDSSKQSFNDFEKLKEKIGLSKQRKPRYEGSSIYQSPQAYQLSNHISSIRERIQEVKHRSAVQQSERQLDYMRSFQRSLCESIRKTKLLRSMLEKQLSSEFSPLSLLRGDEDDVGREIY